VRSHAHDGPYERPRGESDEVMPGSQRAVGTSSSQKGAEVQSRAREGHRLLVVTGSRFLLSTSLDRRAGGGL